jgi:type VI secretion system protein ImpF
MIARTKNHPAELTLPSQRAAKNPKRYQTKFLPNLFDRLSDNYKYRNNDAGHDVALSIADYKQSVLKDLNYLLNSLNSETHLNEYEFPHILESTINYGIPPIAGDFLTQNRAFQIEKLITKAIHLFEPRILKESLFVTPIMSNDKMVNYNMIGFKIGGLLAMEPYPLDFVIQTVLDVETNRMSVVSTS